MAKKNRKRDEVSPLLKARASAWAAANRGIITRIAKECNPPVSTAFVWSVVRKTRSSSDGRVERLLVQYGAPI